MDKKRVIVVLDLDGTLHDGFEYYVKAHMKTIEKLEACGLVIPEELKFFDAQYKNYVQCVKCIPFYYSIFLAEYKEEIEKHREEIERNGLEAKKLIEEIKKRYVPEKIYILTANPQAKVLVRCLSIGIPSRRVVVIDGKEYVKEKAKFLKRLKRSGKIIYVADAEEDEIIAKSIGVEYVNVLSLKSDISFFH